MKREFKFRAWSKNQKRFIKKTSVYSNMIPCISTRYGFKLQSKFVLQQFIGQHDKAGAEIYEGDILIYRGAKNTYTWIIEVVWDEDGFKAKWADRTDPSNPRKTVGRVVWQHFKKVGNIFQSSKLRP